MCRLIYHFSKSPTSRAKAFKYLVKACNECMERSAFMDAANLAVKATESAASRTELRVLLDVMECGLSVLNSKKQLSSFFSKGSTRVDNFAKTFKLR